MQFKCLDCLEMTVDRNKNIKGTSGEVSEGNEKHIIRNWKKGKPCCLLAENLAELCSVG